MTTTISMVSLHHLTHAVCIVIIAFLLKKYTELTNSHNQLMLELKELQSSCGGIKSPLSAHTNPPLCPCSAQSSQGHSVHPLTDLKMSPTEIKSHVQTSSKQRNSPSSVIGSQVYADRLGSSDAGVDEFGRTSDHGGNTNSDRTEVEMEDSTDFQSLSLSGPALQPSVFSSESASRGGGGWESARQGMNGWTEAADRSSVSFQATSESLEKINPSSSSAGGYSTVGSSNRGRHAGKGEAVDVDNDFYQGSRSRHSEVADEVDVIVTSIEGSLNKDLSAHGIDFSFQTLEDYDDGDFEEWEEQETKEEEPHPAFGNVKLGWLTDQEKQDMSAEGSSVQCAGHSLSDRMCRFRHLCFNPETQQFVFFLGPRSVQDNVPAQPSQQVLLEMSTVAGHNAQYFSYLTLPASALLDFHIAPVWGMTVIFKRFKPDNIMHVFHDDIFPLFYTLMSLHIKPNTDSRKFPMSLFLADENSEGEFYDMYDVFAARDTFTQGSLIASLRKTGKSPSLACFSEAQVGLAKTTTWYQYGFFTPQGPIPNSQIQSHQLHSVTSYLLDRFARECALCGEGGHLVLISRKETRRILNEMELVMAISKEFRVKVMVVSLETHDLADILPIIHSSLGIVGMHGSLLVLAAFLRQGSVMVELFPYAVPPENYAPYATLSKIPGMFIAYRAWSNQEANRSVPHPDWSAEFGGIQHLPPKQQQEIVSQVEVPPHLCCEDPSWLYHIFQDTDVNVPQVLSLLSSALQESGPLRALSLHHPGSQSQHTGPPQNLRCLVERLEGRTALILEWAPPWDAGGVGKRVKYSVVLQEVDSGRGRKVMEVGETLRVKVKDGVREGVDYRVWLWSRVRGIHGRFAAVVHCSTK